MTISTYRSIDNHSLAPSQNLRRVGPDGVHAAVTKPAGTSALVGTRQLAVAPVGGGGGGKAREAEHNAVI